MEEVILEVQLREKEEKPRALRREGFIPAVVYGAGKDTKSLKLRRHDFVHFIHTHHMESTVLSLKIGGKNAHTALVREVQYDPVQETAIHIDFKEISLTSKIKVTVGIAAEGEAVGVKQDGGTLNHMIWELEIECLPTKIPPEIKVDVSELKIGDVIYVRDLPVPKDVQIVTDGDSLVFSVEPPAKEEEVVSEEAAAEEGADTTGPEVIKEKKEDKPEGAKEEAG